MRFAVVGDSFSEGIGDELPDGTPRGWADLVAVGLASGLNEPVEYANLAIRGRLLAPIVDEQLEAALALEPTVITLNGGGNDIMRPGTDAAGLVGLISRAIDRCRAADVRLIVVSGADPSRQLPAGKTIHRRGEELNMLVSALCSRSGVTYADNWSDAEIRRPAYWSPDRLHLNAIGHQRAAARVLAAFGLTAPAEWLVPVEGDDLRITLAGNAAYYGRYVVPWVRRRLAGRSSGDGRDPKHAEWFLVSPVR